MKQYYLTSHYTEDKQLAVQQSHASMRMCREYFGNAKKGTEEARVINEYSHHHETTICLGVSQPTEILSLYAFIYKHQAELKIPFGIFNERSLNKVHTAATFITNEKLSHPIARGIRKLLADQNIFSFYDFTEEKTYKNRDGSLIFDVCINNDASIRFDVSFYRKKFKSAQNEELMPTELTPEILEQIYQKDHEEDYLFNLGLNRYVKPDEMEIVKASYSITEMVFLDLISKYRLKQ